MKDNYVISVIISGKDYDNVLKRFRELVPEPIMDNDDGRIISIITKDVYKENYDHSQKYLKIKAHIKTLKELL